MSRLPINAPPDVVIGALVVEGAMLVVAPALVAA